MLNEFINYLEGQVDKGLYVLGGQTQVIKDGIVYKDDTMQKQLGTLKKWMADVGQTSNDYNIVNALYQNRIKRWGNITFRIMDCSGLGMNFLYNKKRIASGDMTANGMKAKCKAISKGDLKRGDWVFKVKNGRATHIGYIVDDNLNVIEDYGKKKGVIKRSLSAGGWNAYGRPSYFKDEIEKEIDTIKYIFKRVLKYVKPTMVGDDVKALQLMLNESNNANLAIDGRFGPATEKAVKAYQKEKGLVVDGKAGPKTISALGGVWIG